MAKSLQLWWILKFYVNLFSHFCCFNFLLFFYFFSSLSVALCVSSEALQCTLTNYHCVQQVDESRGLIPVYSGQLLPLALGKVSTEQSFLTNKGPRTWLIKVTLLSNGLGYILQLIWLKLQQCFMERFKSYGPFCGKVPELPVSS